MESTCATTFPRVHSSSAVIIAGNTGTNRFALPERRLVEREIAVGARGDTMREFLVTTGVGEMLRRREIFPRNLLLFFLIRRNVIELFRQKPILH